MSAGRDMDSETRPGVSWVGPRAADIEDITHGPSGLRPSHLRDAVACPSPNRADQLLTSLTRFVNLLAAGQTPKFIIPHLCGATLLPCRKKLEGHRPIAIGKVLCRLVS